MMNKLKPLPLKDVTIEGGFWGKYRRLVREKVLPYQWAVLNDRVPDAARSHCVKNFEIAAGRRQGQHYGMVFQDSDVYKWLESVAYSLATYPDAALEKTADAAIELIGAAQRPDGYLNTYYTIKEPDGRWTNLQQGHELYCAGHLIEAAVAYSDATGKTELLHIAIRFADCIDKTFGVGEDKINGYPGHQIIELALYKLYQATAEKRYLLLAVYFIRQRGTEPNYFDLERKQPGYKEIFPEVAGFPRTYSQSHMPARRQRTVVGHAVRAVYMYSAMADIMAETGDPALRAACAALYDDLVSKQMFITGAIGATATGESFTSAYDLPNDTNYGETCASVGLMMFCRRLNAFYGDAHYADIMENALYNTVLAGISLTGTAFFYVNPLAVEPQKLAHNPAYRHIKPVRQKWFDCSCCPTNIARTVMGLGKYAYASSGDGIYINLYCSGSAKDGARSLTVATDYPYGQTAAITAVGGRFKLYLRSPQNAPITSVSIGAEITDVQALPLENGYIVLDNDWRGDTITITFDMRPKRVYSSVRLQQNIGKVAVMRGPLVYCAEQADNGGGLGAYLLPEDAALTEIPAPEGLPPESVALAAKTYRYADSQNGLYADTGPLITENGDIKLIPYFLWGNRGENEMRVYLNTCRNLPGNPK